MLWIITWERANRMIKMDQSSDTLTDVKKDKQKVDFQPVTVMISEGIMTQKRNESVYKINNEKNTSLLIFLGGRQNI